MPKYARYTNYAEHHGDRFSAIYAILDCDEDGEYQDPRPQCCDGQPMRFMGTLPDHPKPIFRCGICKRDQLENGQMMLELGGDHAND